MAHNVPAELASTIQSASIKSSPDTKYDVNPSTSASRKTPVRVASKQRTAPWSSPSSPTAPEAQADSPGDVEAETATNEIPVSVLEAPPRRQNLPPLPDLRFEQSYLARVKPYLEQKAYWRVAWITLFDHVMMPFAQGVAWNLSVWGWRAWNTAVKFQGEGAGARIRRWWWSTNHWTLPTPPGQAPGVNNAQG